MKQLYDIIASKANKNMKISLPRQEASSEENGDERTWIESSCF
jgi:hypothetical protein